MKDKNVLKLREWHQAPHPQDVFWDNLGTRGVIPGHKMIDLNLVEGQITIQIVSFTQMRGIMSEYNIRVCQVGSEPLGGTDLKAESGVNE